MTGNIHLKQAMKGLWGKTTMLCLGLYAFEMLFAILSTSPAINAQMLSDMKKTPAMMEKVFGQGFMDAMVKYGMIAFGYIHPFMMVMFVLFIFISFSQVLTSEINGGAIGFTLSKPLSRKRLFINLAILNYAGLACLAFSAFLSSFTGIKLFHAGVLSAKPFLSISWNLYLVMIFAAGYLAIFASFTDSGKAFYTWGGITLLVFYILSTAKTLWSPLTYIAPVSPFSYYDPMLMLMGGRLENGTVIGIIATSVAMFTAAGWIFCRKDIASG